MQEYTAVLGTEKTCSLRSWFCYSYKNYQVWVLDNDA